jgi:hypothetical protein
MRSRVQHLLEEREKTTVGNITGKKAHRASTYGAPIRSGATGPTGPSGGGITLRCNPAQASDNRGAALTVAVVSV